MWFLREIPIDRERDQQRLTGEWLTHRRDWTSMLGPSVGNGVRICGNEDDWDFVIACDFARSIDAVTIAL